MLDPSGASCTGAETTTNYEPRTAGRNYSSTTANNSSNDRAPGRANNRSAYQPATPANGFSPCGTDLGSRVVEPRWVRVTSRTVAYICIEINASVLSERIVIDKSAKTRAVSD